MRFEEKIWCPRLVLISVVLIPLAEPVPELDFGDFIISNILPAELYCEIDSRAGTNYNLVQSVPEHG